MIYNITDIAYEQISGDYYWAKYGDFKVIMDIKTGYINATRLCELANTKADTKKEFKTWRQNATAIELMDAVSSEVRKSTADLLVVVAGGHIIEIRGTYAHPDLIPHIACWASRKFGVKVSKIVNNQLVREYKEEIRVKNNEIIDLKQTIDTMNKRYNEIISKSDTQIQKIEEQSQQVRELLTATREAKEETYQMKEQLDDLSVVNTKLETAVTTIATKLDISTDQRVPKHPIEKFNEVFAVCHNPNTRTYKTVCRKKKTVQSRLRELKLEGYSAIIYYCDSPNARNLYTRVRTTIPFNYGTVTQYEITLHPGKTTQDLINHIRVVEMEKKNV